MDIRHSFIVVVAAVCVLWPFGRAAAQPTLRLEARIVHLRQVTFIKEGLNTGASGWGRARVIADVFLVDVASDTVLAQFTAEGRGALGRATEDAIRRTAEQILRFMADGLRSSPNRIVKGVQE